MLKAEEHGIVVPRNGIYILQGEMSLVVAALRRNSRGGSHSHQVGLIYLRRDILLMVEKFKSTRSANMAGFGRHIYKYKPSFGASLVSAVTILFNFQTRFH